MVMGTVASQYGCKANKVSSCDCVLYMFTYLALGNVPAYITKKFLSYIAYFDDKYEINAFINL